MERNILKLKSKLESKGGNEMDKNEWIKSIISSFPYSVIEKREVYKKDGIKLNYDIIDENGEEWRLGIYLVKKPKIPTMGISNLVDDENDYRKFCLFIDYDNINEAIVRNEVAWIVDYYKLTNAYLFYTRRYEEENCLNENERYYGNYQVIIPDIMPYHKVIEILEKTSCDRNFLMAHSYSRYKMWFLRFIGKDEPEAPVFLDIIPKEPVNMDNLVSRKHIMFLRMWYGVPALPYKNMDNSKAIQFTCYLTGKSQKEVK